jgi:hypothetical protein
VAQPLVTSQLTHAAQKLAPDACSAQLRGEDYLAAREDGVVTIGELEALDPLMGHARLFGQARHPFRPIENDVPVVTATGTLQDGRSFRLHIILHFMKDHRLVQVDFGD